MPTRDYDFQGFDRIRINGAFEFNVTRADAFKVNITSDPLKVIEVSREGDTLRIGIAWYTYLWWFLTWWSHPRASITLPELRELRISGASHGETGDFSTTHDFSLDLAGASGLRLGNISAGNVDFRVQGASHLEFKKVKGAKGSLNILGASRVKGEVELSGDVGWTSRELAAWSFPAAPTMPSSISGRQPGQAGKLYRAQREGKGGRGV